MTRGVVPGLICLSMLFIVSCSDDDEGDTEPSVSLKTGFVLALQTPANNFLVKYFSTLPTGTADVTDGQNFEEFQVTDIYDGALYGRATDRNGAFAKFVVNENGQLVEEAAISTADDDDVPITIKVIDASTGLFHDRSNSTEISVFNPTTMELTGVIDMSAGTVPAPQRFDTFIIRGDEVFAPLRPEAGRSFSSTIVQSANFRTGDYLNTTQFESGNATYPFHFGQNWTDEDGNVWVTHQAAPFDNNFVSSIHRIPAGSTEFDDYAFVAALAVNPANQLLPVISQIYHLGNGVAVAMVIADVPPRVLEILESVNGNPRDFTDEQFQEVLNLFFTEKTGRWVELDLINRTADIIEGMPAQGGFAISFATEINGEVYLSITNPEENAFYRYNATTNQATKAFDVVGGSISQFHDISRNN